MNQRQAHALSLLRTHSSRDLYEGAARNGRDGSGNYWVTHTGGEPAYEPLTWDDVRELIDADLLRDKWPYATHKDSHGYCGTFELVPQWIER